MTLADKVVRYAKPQAKPYSINDGRGLSLYVASNGTKSWHFRFSWQGKQCRISLGIFPAVGLGEARILCRNSHELLAKEVDPRVYRRQLRNPAAGCLLFRQFAKSWLIFKLKRLDMIASREIKHEGRATTVIQIERALEKDILPLLGDKPLGSITRADVLEVQRHIEKRGAFAVAKKVRTWLKELFSYAVVLGEVPLNPALYLGELAFPSLGGRGMNPYLSLKELPELLVRLRDYQGTRQVQWAIRLLLLTGVRLADLRFAELDQIDFEQGIWSINVSRHPNNQQERNSRHRSQPTYIIPLSTQALSIIHKLCECASPEQRYLLSNRLDPQQTISENTLNMALKRLGFDGRLTSQGLRSTLFEALLELGYKELWINTQMYHFDREKIRRTYNHAQYIAQRRQMMQAWANLLDEWEKEEQFRIGY